MLIDELRAGNFNRVSRNLKPILEELLSRYGYEIYEVHAIEKKPECFEIVLNRPIEPSIESRLTLDSGVDCFDDVDQEESKAGIGFLCRDSGQTISGKSW